MTNLTPLEISKLPFGKKCRYGIANRETKQLIHSSDSELWIKGELQRLLSCKIPIRYQRLTVRNCTLCQKQKATCPKPGHRSRVKLRVLMLTFKSLH